MKSHEMGNGPIRWVTCNSGVPLRSTHGQHGCGQLNTAACNKENKAVKTESCEMGMPIRQVTKEPEHKLTSFKHGAAAHNLKCGH